MALSSPGIGSNLDVKGFVSQLMQVEALPLNALAKKEAAYLSKVSAFGTLKGSLTSFQSALDALRTPAKFQAVSATAADTTILGASATNKSVPGTYTVDVQRLAQAQTIASAGQASSTTPVGDGAKTTLSIQFGAITGGKLVSGAYVNDPAATPPDPVFTQNPDQSGGSIVIDASNNSLQGIRDAINKAGMGVTATIVSDGSATPNHLVLTSDKTGAKQSMKITVDRDPTAPVDDTLKNLLAYDPAGTQAMTQSSAAQDSALTVNGIAVTSANRSVGEAIQGVSLTLSKIGSTAVTVARDTNSVQGAVTSLVKAYNDLDKTIKQLTSYDAATKTGGPLLGEASVRNIQTSIRSMLGQPLEGSAGAFNNLTQVGVSFQKDGTLALDSAKLTKAMTSNFNDIAGLFASIGTTTDPLVSYNGSTASTAAGSGTLHVSALATRGSVAGTAAANLVINAGVNDQINVTVDGVSTSVTLPPATYTASSLAAALQAKVNGTSELVGAGAAVTVRADADGKLEIESNRYGSASKIVVSGSGASDLFQSATPTDGTDVQGTIGGVAATGSGQFLTGGTASVLSGLKLEITGGGAPADRGTVAYSRGYADQMTKLLEQFTSTDGLVNGQTTSLQKTVTDIGKARDALNTRLAATEKRYLAQFTALDVAIGRMTSTSNYLTQQLAQLSSMNG
ncbi:flagellar filament capping protein FliD [Massilia yuzhufengensis]|uniref:Flagellar hook-associated protein 2 n=1 Tax=Massilia yuzhufengensis TaxID=1164594 RepID=A0A1I1MV38_9BURK|nr:flagellar filament capping protein FliD [Massilia yuzhufengensis]SFC86423.1 flagellar hook-associated protein 2 [Massilia yuzhufengensis]